MLPSLEDEGVQVIVEDLVEEGVVAFTKGRGIVQHLLGPLPQFEEAKNGGVGDGLFKVGILNAIACFSQGQPSCRYHKVVSGCTT